MKLQQGRCAHMPGAARSEGRSSTAAAAYRAGISVIDERTGEVHDYTRKKGVEHSEIIVPEVASIELKRCARLSRSRDEKKRTEGHSAFWNANEKSHKRQRSIVSREIQTDLPMELSEQDRKEVALEFGRQIAERYKCGVQVSIHAPHEVTDRDLENNPEQHAVIDPDTGVRHNGNWHVHYLLTTQELNVDGFGNKIKELDPGERKFKPELENPVLWTRPKWEELVQGMLRRRGINKLYTTLNKDETRELLIGMGKYDMAATIGEPTVHMGPAATALERMGKSTEIGDKNRDIEEKNRQYQVRAELISAVLKKLCDSKSYFSEKELYRELYRHGSEVFADEIHEVAAQAICRQDLLVLGTDKIGNALFTTSEMLNIEQTMVKTAVSRRGEGRHLAPAECVDFYAKKSGLSEEQTTALHHMSGVDGVALVEGMAGTGKSTMMGAAREAWESIGYEVRGLALAGKAAAGLEEGSGIKSQTVHSLLSQIEKGSTKLKPNTILVLDEAGMLSSRLTGRLVEEATKAGSKLVMVGDDRQIQPIQAGGAFHSIKQELGAKKLTTIYRQKDEWAREAVHDFADGNAKNALSEYAKRGLVFVGADDLEAKTQLVEHWNEGRSADCRDAVMLASTRRNVRQLNEAARQVRIESEEIDQGETVKTENGVRGFSKGDRLIFLRNDRQLDVKNGMIGTVESIEDGKLQVQLDAGRSVAFDTQAYGYIDHGYATTIHKAQGLTIDRAYVLAGHMHDRELSYVSMSRTSVETRLYLDASKYGNEAKLARQMSESNIKDTTVDVLREIEQEPERGQLTKREVLDRIGEKDGVTVDWQKYVDMDDVESSRNQELRDDDWWQDQWEEPKDQKSETSREVEEYHFNIDAEFERALEAAYREELDQHFKLEPIVPNREIVELQAIDQELNKYQASLEEEFLAERGERPEVRSGFFGVASRRKAERWDEARQELNDDVEARRLFLSSDAPEAMKFRDDAWNKAELEHAGQVSSWMKEMPRDPKEMGVDMNLDSGMSNERVDQPVGPGVELQRQGGRAEREQPSREDEDLTQKLRSIQQRREEGAKQQEEPDRDDRFKEKLKSWKRSMQSSRADETPMIQREGQDEREEPDASRQSTAKRLEQGESQQKELGQSSRADNAQNVEREGQGEREEPNASRQSTLEQDEGQEESRQTSRADEDLSQALRELQARRQETERADDLKRELEKERDDVGLGRW